MGKWGNEVCVCLGGGGEGYQQVGNKLSLIDGAFGLVKCQHVWLDRNVSLAKYGSVLFDRIVGYDNNKFDGAK